jgi:hypothetical protein
MEHLHAPLQPSAGSALPSSHCSGKKNRKTLIFFSKLFFLRGRRAWAIVALLARHAVSAFVLFVPAKKVPVFVLLY